MKYKYLMNYALRSILIIIIKEIQQFPSCIFVFAEAFQLANICWLMISADYLFYSQPSCMFTQ